MRRSIRKKCVFLALMMSMVITLLTACGGDAGTQQIYYMDVAGNSLKISAYKLKAKDTEGQISELLTALKQAPDTGSAVSVMPRDLEVISHRLDGGHLVLDFNTAYERITGPNEVLMRSAIVKTLLQISNISSVTFTVQGKALTNADGSEIGAMNADTFMDFGGDAEDAMVRRTFTLYYASKDGQSLVREKREIYYNRNISPEKLVMEYLMTSPHTDDAISPIPDSTKLLNINVNRGVCYLNLDENFLNATDKISQQVVIYSIVNSLCELNEISSVQIAINGEMNSIFRGDKLSNSYTPNFNMVTSDAE